MAQYSFVLTDRGAALLAKVQLGSALHFTRAAVGSGILDAEVSLEDLTDLISFEQVVEINSLSVRDGSAVIRLILNNADVSTGFSVTEIGLFATDPDAGEVLYAIAYAGDQADTCPAYDGSNIVEFIWDLICSVGAAEVTVTIDDTAVFITRREFEARAVMKAGDSMQGALNEIKGATLASASTVNLGAATGNFVDISGTNTIQSFGVAQAGTRRKVRFLGSLVLTHNETSLILPTGANVATAAGDIAEFHSLGSGNWVCTGYQRASGKSLVDSVPPGAVAHFAMASAPFGWLKANGAAVSRTTYAALFAAIGTTFGVGDGSTTFNLPDLRGEFIRGYDDGRGVDSGRAFGSSQSDAFKTTNINIPCSGESNNVGYTATAGAASNSGSVVATVNGGANETRPRNVALLACIKH
jgi:phage-related tail fiber protein